MKYILTTIYLLTITGSIFSQTISQLDSKYGFKHFIFNTPPSKYKREIRKLTSWDSNLKITQYEYKGGEITDLLGVPVTKVFFSYYENKLSAIQIEFGNKDKGFNKEEYKKILLSLQKLYGQGKSVTVYDEDFIPYGGRKWIGKKVTMEVLHLYYKPARSFIGYITIKEKSMHEKRVSEELNGEKERNLTIAEN